MAIVDIREVAGDEYLEIALRVAGYAFEASPPGVDRAEWAEFLSLVEARHFVAFEDASGVTTASYSRMGQQVRGAMFTVGGVWGVASDPRVRRKGYVRQARGQLFAAMHADEMPLSVLYPFRESFYDRLGYVTFPQPRVATIAASALLPLLKWELPGSVELLSAADGFDRYRAYLERQRQRSHGMALFGDRPASRMRKQNKVWVLAAQVDGEDVGMMTYRIEGQGKNLISHSFYPADSRGRYLLLAWLARHADQIKDVELKLPPSMQPETWLPDLGVELSVAHAPMARVVDVRGLKGVPAGVGRFSASIIDIQCPWNEGSFAFEAADGVLHVTPVQAVDCSLTVQGLTALVYGTHDPGDFALRGWGNPAPSTKATMRTMFPPALPYLHEVF